MPAVLSSNSSRERALISCRLHIVAELMSCLEMPPCTPLLHRPRIYIPSPCEDATSPRSPAFSTPPLPTVPPPTLPIFNQPGIPFLGAKWNFHRLRVQRAAVSSERLLPPLRPPQSPETACQPSLSHTSRSLKPRVIHSNADPLISLRLYLKLFCHAGTWKSERQRMPNKVACVHARTCARLSHCTLRC